MAQVELQSVSKIYWTKKKSIAGADGLSFTVPDKTATVLVGPSGCGKTTTLRMIAGLETATAGNILIDGQCVNGWPPSARDTAMVFQNYALYPHMTIFDNMAFGLRVNHFPKEEIRKRVCYAAEILRLTDDLERKPHTLSGGQRQRVAVGRAIVRQPKVFLFDEPLSNLDAKLRVEMRMELMRLKKELDWTMIYVTHDQAEAMTMADRMVVMDHGKIQQSGNPGTIYEEPENKFVAEFVGTPPMNLVEGEMTSDWYFMCDGQNLKLKPKSRFVRRVVLGARPDHIEFAAAAETADGWKARLEFMEHLGSEIHLYFRIGTNRIVVKTVRQVDRSEVGKAFYLNPARDKLFVFDAENGIRIH
jgi:ABC-type sugar transport system ATPase subunit